ncbi:hypothetical protein [uncultured Tenacibaculum sp.]|uniref:hypothetical protein n=1 Tax=uncultured Tenacibaculum sp. TaxID=174713 RepID=UPI002620AF0A|nr:hypothetical protein [uncultured Tenacibaculum sp.]
MKKEIINCPSCNYRVRVPKNKNILFTCPKCQNKVHYDGRLNKKPFYIGLVIIAVIIAYFGFFDDYFAYLGVKNKRTREACTSYYNAHPKGNFTEEVRFIEVEVTEDIEVVREFLNAHPNSEKKEEVLRINGNIWEEEIKRYDKLVENKENFDADAVNFFRSLLRYMRDHNVATIGLELTGNTDVKNFQDYDLSVQNTLDEYFQVLDKRKISENIIDITSNYSQGYIRQYEDIIIDALEGSFENILSHNFIKVTASQYTKTPLHISIKYQIKNQEDRIFMKDKNHPVIWVYSKGNTINGEKEFASYLIGVAINFSFEMNIPDSAQKFDFDQKTNALDNIQNIQSIEEGYRRMTAQNFYNFTNIISRKFGLLEENQEKEKSTKK